LKIQLASDLHLEMLEKKFPGARIVDPVEGADVLVLAGDIQEATKAVEVFGEWPVPVLYVAGNHEFYGHWWEQTRVDIRPACAGTSITYLDNDAVELGGVRFLGCTLWTDFQLRGFTRQQWMHEVGQGLNDYWRIATQEGVLRPDQTLEDHERSRRWLEQELAKPFAGETVVITHHGPHPLSVHPRYLGNPTNAGFVSDLTPLLFKTNLWLHGHVHDSFDYEVGGCRVVANPAGYVLNSVVATVSTGFEFENRRFDPRLVLEWPLTGVTMDALKDLIAAHPKMFRGLPPVVPSDLPPGWYSLVDKLCSDIEALLGGEPERFEVTQIKEKYGGLRFYFSFEGAEDRFVDFHSSEGIETFVQQGDGPAVMTRLRMLVSAASEHSTSICQDCGAPGTLANRQGWFSTLCERHSAERVSS